MIYLRGKSKLPVIIMGEEGCGKTSLVYFLCNDVLRERIEIINIYAGISKKIIFERMESILNDAKDYIN